MERLWPGPSRKESSEEGILESCGILRETEKYNATLKSKTRMLSAEGSNYKDCNTNEVGRFKGTERRSAWKQ